MNIQDYFPIWNQLSLNHQIQLQNATMKQSLGKDEIIQNSADECKGLYLVKSGQLRIYMNSADGREITLYRLFEGDICLFSASCIMRSFQFDMSIKVEKDTEVYIISSGVYKSVMEQSAVLANYTNEIMASRFSEVMWLMEQIMFKSMDKRLAQFLVEESYLENTTVLKMTHEMIANHLGTAREVVSRMLKYMQNETLVKLTRGTIELINIDDLEKMSE